MAGAPQEYSEPAASAAAAPGTDLWEPNHQYGDDLTQTQVYTPVFGPRGDRQTREEPLTQTQVYTPVVGPRADRQTPDQTQRASIFGLRATQQQQQQLQQQRMSAAGSGQYNVGQQTATGPIAVVAQHRIPSTSTVPTSVPRFTGSGHALRDELPAVHRPTVEPVWSSPSWPAGPPPAHGQDAGARLYAAIDARMQAMEQVIQTMSRQVQQLTAPASSRTKRARQEVTGSENVIICEAEQALLFSRYPSKSALHALLTSFGSYGKVLGRTDERRPQQKDLVLTLVRNPFLVMFVA